MQLRFADFFFLARNNDLIFDSCHRQAARPSNWMNTLIIIIKLQNTKSCQNHEQNPNKSQSTDTSAFVLLSFVRFNSFWTNTCRNDVAHHPLCIFRWYVIQHACFGCKSKQLRQHQTMHWLNALNCYRH